MLENELAEYAKRVKQEGLERIISSSISSAMSETRSVKQVILRTKEFPIFCLFYSCLINYLPCHSFIYFKLTLI